jgi:hypothetical protein
LELCVRAACVPNAEAGFEVEGSVLKSPELFNKVRRCAFDQPEPWVTPDQIKELRALVALKGWTWPEFRTFICETLMTIPSCMTEREAAAVIKHFREEDNRKTLVHGATG